MGKREIRDLAVSAVVIALAFAIAMNGGFPNLFKASVISLFIFSLVTVSVSFIAHELAHRFVSRKYGHYAEYRKWNLGLALAMLFSVFGFVFAAPGAVVIHNRSDMWGRDIQLSRKKHGIISLSGPATNLILAMLFYIVFLISPATIWSVGITINLWLAAFNLIPVSPLDGSKVFAWNRPVWLAFFLMSVILLVFLSM